MDHNANAVALADINAANQLFTATYHLYVGDVNGRALPGYGDTTTTWATTATNLTLATADVLTETNWVTVTNPPVFAGGQATVILQPLSGGKFFRLQLNL
jgi:hypothetical protein